MMLMSQMLARLASPEGVVVGKVPWQVVAVDGRVL